MNLADFSTATLLDRKRRLEAQLNQADSFCSGRAAVPLELSLWLEWKEILEELMDRQYYGRVEIQHLDATQFAQLTGAISDEE